MIIRQGYKEYSGLSTDDKNTIKEAHVMFHEIDTGKYYIKPGVEGIPEEYTQLEYLQGNITKPYIDTGWKFTHQGHTYLRLKVEPTDVSGNASFSCGSANTLGLQNDINDESNNLAYFGLGNFSRWWFNWDSLPESQAPAPQLGKIITAESKPVNGFNRWFLDNVDVTQYSAVTTSSLQNNNFTIFAVNTYAGLKVSYRVGGRVYSFYVEEFDKPVLNMVPVIRDRDNKPGMFDTVSNTFFVNQETDTANSEFTYGELQWTEITGVVNKDWKHITPDPSIPTIPNVLPVEYAECEWLDTQATSEAVRGAIIDTEYAYSDPDEIRIVSTYKKDTGNEKGTAFGVDFFGASGGSRLMHGHMWTNGSGGYTGLYLGNGKVAEATKSYINTKITLDFNYNVGTDGIGHAKWIITDHDNNDAQETVTWNGTSGNKTNGWTGTDTTDYLGGTHSYKDPVEPSIYTGNKWLKGKLYRHTMYHHNEKVRDFIPCVRIADNKPGMYDLVGRKFYRAYDGVVYGFHVDSTISDPSTAVTYLADAVGMTPAFMDYAASRFNYGSWENAFFMPRPCMLYSSGKRAYYLDPNDYSKKEDGTPSDVANENFDGNAMMEWGKNGSAIWWKLVGDASASNASYSVYIADHQADADYKCWNHYNKNNKIIEHFYTPIYAGSKDTSGTKIRSLSGKETFYGETVVQLYQEAIANGNCWECETWVDKLLIYLLLYLMGKSLDLQTTYGRGNVGDGNFLNTGTLNDKGLFYGYNTNNYGLKVFGMEHVWGNQLRLTLGLLLNNGTFYYKLTQGTADGSTATNYSITSTDGMLQGTSLTDEQITEGDAEPNSGWIRTMNVTANNSNTLLPAQLNGSSTTYYCDAYYFSASGINISAIGGRRMLGDCCGFMISNEITSSQSSSALNASLSCKPVSTTHRL